ncbi:sensor histidine kinase [Fibrella forsythiae]|uniref:histidine kinase n=1 Tax=Fibrella forsythiae TaxID=2817061 RepID=A0ABS3JFE3_9BACT|nr:ATP-binding protein [Fibrella forsythiae]MBO0947627.1 PAS domain-containing protein [Fibrella forsythiae]
MYSIPPVTTSLPNGPSDGLLQIALDQSASGIIVFEARRDEARKSIQTYKIVLVNKRAEQVIGLQREDLLGQTVDKLFPESIGADLWSNAGQVIDTGIAHRQDLFYHSRRTNSAAWYDLVTEPVGDGERAVVSFTDISELRSAQETMLTDSILFKALSSTVPEVGVIVTNYFKKVLVASGTLPGLLAKTDPDELVGRLLENNVLPEFREDWRNYLGTALTGESHFFSDHWGGWRSEVYVGPVRNQAGVVVMILIVFRNVTEQYRQQQALIQSNTALQQSNQNLEQFAYVASHDLQEPLRKIRAFGDLLKANYASVVGDQGVDMIHRMQAASDRMSTLIQSLLSYARLSSDQKPQGIVHLEDLFNELIFDLSVLIQERNGVVRLKPPIPMIPGDEQQLRQLFQNLLTNALKFVPPERTPLITLSARIVEGPNVPNLATSADSVYAELIVKDNGIGIEPVNFDKIFGLFNRLHGRRQFEGSGIGLATTKKVVDNHNGTISLESEVGKGTEFRVYLPMNSERVITKS